MERLSFEYVKNYIEKEGCKLISTEYKGICEKLLIQCSCGEIFEKSFFNFKNNNQKQCKKCGHKNGGGKRRNQVIFNCEYCGKECSQIKSQFERNKHHFCSRECHDEFQKNQVTFNCEYCGKESSVCKSEFDRYEHHFCSKECQGKWCKGENNPRYNPNLTDEEREIGRNIEGYDDFIIDVLKRDNYTCQCCGQYGGSLNVHHLNSYHWDKEHRTDVDNGICLCSKCHKEYHKLYGNKNNTIAQFKEFLFNKYIQSQNLKFLALIETIDLTTRAF